VDSVLSQRDVDVRVLIIDDASSDDTPAVGEQLTANDSRVVFRRHATNFGHIKTFNEGIMDWARAPYSLLLSADDALAPGALARAVKVMDSHNDIGMTYGTARIIFDERALAEVQDSADFDYQIISGAGYLQHSCESGNGVPTPTAVIRTELQHRVGGYNPAMLHTSDMEMWMRIATQSSIGVIRTVQGYYRWHGENMTLHYASNVLGDRRQQISTCQEVLENWGAQTEGFGAWVEAMRRRYVAEACWLAGLALERGDAVSERACLAFAEEHEPALWRSPSLWRYFGKRCLGPGLLRKLRSIMRRKPETSSQPEAAHGSWPFKHGQRIGWWPSEQGGQCLRMQY
jgi:Glycosyl transferase family 2